MTSASTANTPSGEGDQHIRLACQACQRKKIKCDRSFPCGQCTRSNLQCAPSIRKPRTRHAGKRAIDSELRNRISKLENLVESLSGEVSLPNGTPGGGDADALDGEPSTAIETTQSDTFASPSVGKYIGSSFWSSLTTEVQALKDALEDDQLDDEADPTSPETSSTGASGNTQTVNDYDLIICPPGAVYVMPGALNEPSPQVQSMLYGAFIENVAPVFHVVHVPTLRAFLERGAPYLGHDADSIPARAVKAATWVAAINTIGEEQCQAQFGQPRSALIQHYRRIVDVLLSQADVMNTNDLATLQALATTTMALRITDMSRRAWTMTSLVVRVARAMDLHHEMPGRSAFETELRRRLWHSIRFLDIFTALDRATEPLITADSYTTPRPHNVNDVEFDESSTSIPNHDRGLTDMAFPLLASEATTFSQRLSMPELSPSGDTWQLRLEIAQQFQKHVQEKYVQHCDMSIPFHRLLSAVSKSMAAGLILRAVRPMQRHVSSVPPRIDSPYVLQIAINVLEENEKAYQDPEAERWRWLVWVQWHALAVALAGLCSIRETELANRAWATLARTYQRHEQHVADTRSGMLWRPIQKLYLKANAFRQGGTRGLQPRQKSVSPPETHTPRSMPMGPMGVAYPVDTTQKQQQQSQLNHHDMPMGSIPLDPSMSAPMDFSTTMTDFNGLTPPQSGDMSWLDWENIMNDFSDMPMDPTMGDMQQSMPLDPTMGDMQQPQHVQKGQEWPCVLHSDLM